MICGLWGEEMFDLVLGNINAQIVLNLNFCIVMEVYFSDSYLDRVGLLYKVIKSGCYLWFY